MPDFSDSLISRRILVSDGAMGTVLFEKGLKPGDCPEALNLSHPGIISAVASSYAAAGADIIQTNTFGGSPMKLAEYGLSEKTEEINRLAVQYVRESVSSDVIVSGSCGPSGMLLVPYGDGKPEEIKAGFVRQIRALIESGADVICIETMIDLQEALLAIAAARSVSSELPVMATMTFDKPPRGYFTIMGVSIADAIASLRAAGADVVGSNCGNGLDKMIEIAQEFKQLTTLPIMIQSNAGQPELSDGRLVYREAPDYFAERIHQLIEIGVSIIGGCCGTTPEHIRAIRRIVDIHNRKLKK